MKPEVRSQSALERMNPFLHAGTHMRARASGQDRKFVAPRRYKRLKANSV